MPQPTHIEGCLLQRVLGKWAACFTPHQALQAKLVEDTITETLEKLSSQDDGVEIDVELFATMRRIALREFSMANAPPKTRQRRESASRNDHRSMKS